jgi:glyoxylase-like metal-dependent hydrolase (beta-lactamase superfamily II)
MSYSGEVTTGGAADLRETAGLTIAKVSVGTIDNNAYLLRCTATGRQLLIDAAADPKRLLALTRAGGLVAVVTTHSHWDHWAALAEVVKATGAHTYAGRDDAAEIEVPTDTLLDDGDTVSFGACSLRVRHLAGHTPGGIALIYDDPDGHAHVFTGDSLFPGGVGNTRNDPARFAALLRDVETKLFDALPDSAWVYPGHGRDTTLGAERPHLAQWRARGW